MSLAAVPLSRPILAIIGRPNVGKSTLFNRLLGRRQAVVSSTRGTTRDRLAASLEWNHTALTLVDTGGMELARTEGLAAVVQQHIRRVLDEADAFLLVCDAQDGLVPADQLLLERLRPTGKPIVLAVNKADQRVVVPPEFFALGLEETFAVSALHGLGIGELLDYLSRRFGHPPHTPPPAVAVAIVGRQNVGKSSLVNALAREERVLVHDQPGTTRDAVDTLLTVGENSMLIIDTAGLRHQRKVRDPVDVFSMARTGEALARCDVALMVLDARHGVTRDDRRILTRIAHLGRGLVILVNKWDLVRERISPSHLTAQVHRAAPFAAFAPVVPVSAKTGYQVSVIPPTLLRVSRTLAHGLSDEECRAFLDDAWRKRPPPRMRGRLLRWHAVCWRMRPPRLEFTVSPPGPLPVPYRHYLRNRLFAHPRLRGVPVDVIVAAPDARRASRRRGR